MKMSRTDTGSVVCTYMCKPLMFHIIAFLLTCHCTVLTSDDAPLRGTMIWLKVLVIQELESDTSDLGLSYSV